MSLKNNAPLSQDERDRLINLEARMRCCSKAEVNEKLKDMLSEESSVQKTTPRRRNKTITEFFENDRKSAKKKKLEDKMNIERDIQVKERSIQYDSLYTENKALKEQNNELKVQLQQSTDRLMKSMETVKVLVLEVEKLKREEFRQMISQRKYSLGEFAISREGVKMVEQWTDGHDIREVRLKLKQLEQQREDIEKKKKQNLKKEDDSMVRASLSLRLAMIMKEEQAMTDQLERLEHDKIMFAKQLKRQFEEDNSRFGKVNSQGLQPQWPVIGDRYQILALQGKGGFSEVYRAYDLHEMREVACKIHQLLPTWSEGSKQNYIKHALRENRVHRQLSHPNIVKQYDSVEMDQNSFCTVLEYCDGLDLSVYLKKYRLFPEKEAKLILIQILSALKYLNNHKNKVTMIQILKIIHYDLKPQNILFHQGEVKISDFGLCKVLENEETRLELTSQGVGTYWYLPPECFLTGDMPPAISSKVDIWSLGCIFYEMLFGQKPFGHGFSQEKILKEQIILNSNQVSFPQKPVVSKECQDFIRSCLAHNQSDRLDVNNAVTHPYISKKPQ